MNATTRLLIVIVNYLSFMAKMMTTLLFAVTRDENGLQQNTMFIDKLDKDTAHILRYYLQIEQS